MRGYKAFDKDLKCRGKQYAVGEEYEEDGTPVICAHGMHFCERLVDVFNYYPFDEDKTRVCEVEILGDVARGDVARGDVASTKCCTNRLKIVRELDWNEICKLVNGGISNTGHHNSGDYNSGNWNSGDQNSGNRNSGDRNSGSENSGNRNSGNHNSGFHNSGNHNSGDRNSGSENSGDWNTGDQNSGDYNSGDYNSGHYNSGDCNSGCYNSGHCNSGCYNSGHYNSGSRNSGWRNSGNHNSGDCNSGDRNIGNDNSGSRNSGSRNSGNCNSGNYNSGSWNSGDWNVADFSSGVLCTEVPECLIFDRPSGMTLAEWRESDASRLLDMVPIDVSEWVFEMTDEEKAAHPEWEITLGYLREGTYKKDFTSWWAGLDDDEKAEIFAIPNFDPDKFEKITGLHVHDEMPKRKTEDDGHDVSGLVKSLNWLFVGWTGSEIAKAIEQTTGKTLR